MSPWHRCRRRFHTCCLIWDILGPYPLVMTVTLQTWTWPLIVDSLIHPWKIVDLSSLLCRRLPEGSRVVYGWLWLILSRNLSWFAGASPSCSMVWPAIWHPFLGYFTVRIPTIIVPLHPILSHNIIYIYIYIYIYIHIYICMYPQPSAHMWIDYNDLTVTSLDSWVNTGNHPHMALFQVCEMI